MSDQRTVTEKRRAANQSAAQKSTGPKTPEGKQRAAFNSFEHGAFASEPHIRQSALEHAADSAGSQADAGLDTLRRQLLDDWQPASAQQSLLVGDLAWLYWLRDQAARALAQAQERQRRRDELRRLERRFNARHRPLSLCGADYSSDGCVNLPDSEAKFPIAARLLDRLEAWLAKADWGGRDENGNRWAAAQVRTGLFGFSHPTLRGERVAKLWIACEKEKAGLKDPRVAEIRALLEEERAALAEEEALFRRRQELDIEEPEAEAVAGFQPLGEAWEKALLTIERLDRQINAKVRLLIRLQTKPALRDAAKPGVPDGERRAESVAQTAVPAVCGFSSSAGADLHVCGEEKPRTSEPEVRATPGDDEPTKIHGTKPTKPLESTERGISPHSTGDSGRETNDTTETIETR